MTLQEFLEKYYCTCDIQTTDNVNLVITSKAKRRLDDFTVDGVTSTMNIHESSNWISDSQTAISLTEWSWEKLLDQAKRLHLDYFAQRATIENYYPLNTEENPDISNMYL